MVCPIFQRSICQLGVMIVALATLNPALAADIDRMKFDIPADLLARSIKVFAQQSGKEILISADLGRGIQTKLVRGDFTPAEAVDRMLSQTGLVAKTDKETGAIVILPMVAVDANGNDVANDDNAKSKKKNQTNPTLIP